MTGDSPGTWSLVNDQGMYVELENGNRYIVNFRYEVKEGDTAGGVEPFTGLTSHDFTKTNMVCDKTMVGFV